ncbi:MAG: GAF domain-containing protein [Ignavibacteriae bacterium]|nr:GAF domain-containing protein [Ignavibacteriota bacterium]NOG97322.1 GAF domain-containing protein [Ignavibacteriota bacterium]
MTENILINKSAGTEEIYKCLLPQIKSLLNSDEPIITGLSNFTAILKDAFDKISWIGFYLLKDDKLYLGPFQGKAACTVIELGKGVCGTSAAKHKTIIVDDVNKFTGHIACDSGSKSEIVIPLIQNEKLIGVLDLDSYDYSAFDSTDKIYLEKICSYLLSTFDFNKFELK